MTTEAHLSLQRSFTAFIYLLLIVQACSPAVFAQGYEEGRQAYIDGNYREAYRILEPLARSGNSEAQKMLAEAVVHGAVLTLEIADVVLKRCRIHLDVGGRLRQHGRRNAQECAEDR